MDVDKKIQINYGMVIVIALSVIPMFAWKLGYDFVGLSFSEAAAVSLAKIGAFGGLSMFALSLILSGRYVWADKLFGGLDKMYVAHRFLGTFSMALLFLHPVAFTLFRLQQDTVSAISIWYSPADIGVFLGAISLYLLLLIGLWSIYARTKYETFVRVHRLLGLVFVVGAAHAFMAGSVLGSSTFMFVYMLALCVPAVLTYLVYSLLGDRLHRVFIYKVTSIKDVGGGITEVLLRPRNRIVKFKPGQFLYIAFPNLKQHGYHPFSIASGDRDTHLKLAIKVGGDFTTAVATIKPGAKAQLRGAHGGFHVRPIKDKSQLWIAGGIGVTPFLSGASSFRKNAKSSPIDMIYASEDAKPYGLGSLRDAASQHKFFEVSVHNSAKSGFLSLAALEERYPDLRTREIYVCGPPIMLQSFINEARAGGFESQLRYEEFSY